MKSAGPGIACLVKMPETTISVPVMKTPRKSFQAMVRLHNKKTGDQEPATGAVEVPVQAMKNDAPGSAGMRSGIITARIRASGASIGHFLPFLGYFLYTA